MLKIYGMLDPHTHLRDLDWSHKATFASETKAAIAGGYTAVFDMPNTPPTTTTRAALQTKLDKINTDAHCDYGVYFGASQHDNTAEYDGLTGVCGLKIFCNATTGDLLIEDMEDQEEHIRAWDVGRVIAVHAEGSTVEQILNIVRHHRKPVHFLHISTADEIKMLQAAKEDGLPVTIGVCPHHLFLTEDSLRTLGPLGLMKPELKTRLDRDALWYAVKKGVVDVIESDHAPHTLDEKLNDAGKPVYGVPGIETTLHLMLLAVKQGWVDLEQIPLLLAENPRRIFGVPKHEGTYTLVDTDVGCEVSNRSLLTAAKWSPFDGMLANGKVREVWIRGKRVYHDGRFMVEPGYGENLFA